jgi:hypothetical protein
VLPIAIAVAGWLFVIQPAASASARAARELDQLEERLTQLRASVSEPAPAPVSDDPRAAFERRVAGHDVSYEVFEQLARLARAQGATGLEIETGDQVMVAAPGGSAMPQATGTAAMPDPRLAMFETALAYTPISMSFDAEFARLGQLLWELRDLATTVEIRTIDVKPVADGPRVHVVLTLFAYARSNTASVALAGGPS